MIRLRFVQHPGPFTWACRVAQYGFWATHVEAVLDDGSRLSSWFHQGGVRILPPDYDAGQFNRELFVDLKATPEQTGIFNAFLHAQVGKPYDWRAIVAFYSFGQSRCWQADDSWFCSELFPAGFVECGLLSDKMAVQASKVTPLGAFQMSSMIAQVG